MYINIQNVKGKKGQVLLIKDLINELRSVLNEIISNGYTRNLADRKFALNKQLQKEIQILKNF